MNNEHTPSSCSLGINNKFTVPAPDELINEKWGIYLRCLQRARFSSVISPSPEIRLISRSFLPMAIAVIADEVYTVF